MTMTMTTRRYVEPPTCSNCSNRGVVGILQRRAREDAWFFRCGYCARIYTETAPRSGRLTDGVHADLWLLENDR